MRTRTFDGRWTHSNFNHIYPVECMMINPTGRHCQGSHASWGLHPHDHNFPYDDSGNWWVPCSIPEEEHARN